MHSYQILNPKGIVGMEDPKKCTKILIESTGLNEDLYRLGNTKAWFCENIYFVLYLQYVLFIQTNTLSHQTHKTPKINNAKTSENINSSICFFFS